MNRQKAWELVKEYNESESLREHALQVEAVMEHFATRYGESVEEWGLVGLLHDLDYEKYPDQHCVMTEKILKEKGLEEHLVRAIMSHGYGICTDVKPETPMEKTLYAIDELTGLVRACCLVRPSKSVLDLKVKSVLSKFKNPKFAEGCDRNLILQGIEMMGMEKNEVIQEVIKGLQEKAEEVGLKGSL